MLGAVEVIECCSHSLDLCDALGDFVGVGGADDGCRGVVEGDRGHWALRERSAVRRGGAATGAGESSATRQSLRRRPTTSSAAMATAMTSPVAPTSKVLASPARPRPPMMARMGLAQHATQAAAMPRTLDRKSRLSNA